MSEITSEQPARGVSWLLIVIGIVFIFIAGYRYISTEQFLANGVWTKGTISGNNFQNDPDGYFYSPIVVYRDRQGGAHQWISDIASNPPRYDIGQVVDVVYRITNPNDALIIDFWELYLIDLVLGGVGILFLVIGPVITVNKKKNELVDMAGVNEDVNTK